MSAFGQTDLERLRYWQGQMLASRDARDQSTLDARRRLLHNRSLHGVSGVAFGLAVKADVVNRGAVTVDCGVAYDCAGRELILQSQHRVQMPGEAAALILRKRQIARENGCCPSTDPGCAPAGRFDLEQDVELVWQTGDALDPLGVVLGRTRVTGSSVEVDTAFRPRLARPIARPHLARGETVRGNTPWENWEVAVPDGQGGFKQNLVGVQTHIDTSAAGFTEVPAYFASLVGPAWDLQTAEFAPTIFPQVADPSVDGFTFRLLMVETARRRYNALALTGRVAKVTRVAGDQMRVEVENASMFRKNDSVAVLRPRGDAAYFIEEQDGTTLTLHAPLPSSAVANQTVLAIGSAPRVANIVSVSSNQTFLATYEAAETLKRNDVLVRFSDHAVTAVNEVSSPGGSKVLTINQPFPAWKKEEELGFALASSAASLDSADTSADGASLLLTLKNADPAIVKDTVLVLMNGRKKPLAAAVTVVKADGNKVQATMPAGLATASAVKMISLVQSNFAVKDLTPQSPVTTVKISHAGRLQKGDYVAASNDLAHAAGVEDVDDSGEEVTLRDPLNLAGVQSLVAANWITATTVDDPPNTATPLRVVVGRAGAVPPGSFLVRVDATGMGRPASVTTVSGTTVSLEKTIEGLARLDTLAVGMFPRVVTVVVQDDPSTVRVQEPNALRAGDIVVRTVPTVPGEPLAEVASAAGNQVTFRQPFAGLAPGQHLGVVNFRDTTQFTGLTANADEAKVSDDISARDGDFVAVLTRYADNSNFGWVQDISGNQLTLRADGIGAGDGIIARDWIDGGILGPAAVRFPEQPFVRLESVEGLNATFGGRQDTAAGFDPAAGQFHSSRVITIVVDGFVDHLPVGTVNRVALIPVSGSFVFRPETLSILATFNSNFPRAFAVFAQKQQLSVNWFGCQQERRQPPPCPGVKTEPETCEGCKD